MIREAVIKVKDMSRLHTVRLEVADSRNFTLGVLGCLLAIERADAIAVARWILAVSDESPGSAPEGS